MKKSLLTALFGLSVAALFTGCGSKSGALAVTMPSGSELNKVEMAAKICRYGIDMNKELCDLEHKKIMLSASSNKSGIVKATKFNNSTYAVVQAAVGYCEEAKKPYFSILSPAPISNFRGSLINTPEELFEKCEIGAGDTLIFNNDPCGMHKAVKAGSNGTNANLAIVAFDKQQDDIVTFNVQEVKAYMLKNDMWDEEAVKRHITPQVKTFGKVYFDFFSDGSKSFKDDF